MGLYVHDLIMFEQWFFLCYNMIEILPYMLFYYVLLEKLRINGGKGLDEGYVFLIFF